MTAASSSKGIRLQRGDGAGSETFTTIAEVTNIKAGGEKATAIDVTSFDSTAFEFIGGLVDSGDLTFDLNFVAHNAQQQGLRTDMRAGTLRNFKLILVDNDSSPTTLTFSAVVTAAPDLSAGVNQAVKSSCSLKVSGLYTWSYAPS